jgi:hypothetical protein
MGICTLIVNQCAYAHGLELEMSARYAHGLEMSAHIHKADVNDNGNKHKFANISANFRKIS